MSLILRTDNGDFDTFGDEEIVQTLAIFNFENISTFNGEYTNNFELPLTNNNSKLIGYADYILNVETAPYKKLNCNLIVGDLEFKSGLLIIEDISDVIKARFISGNSNFYSLIKTIYLGDLDWSAYNHTWNYTNAVASSANTTGYTYPVMNYNGQTLGGNILDIRKILPATFVKTILDLMFSQFSYTAVYNFDTTFLENILLPYSKKNPTISTEILLLNSLDLALTNTYSPSLNNSTTYAFAYYLYPVGIGAFINDVNIPLNFDFIFTPGSSSNYNFINKTFTAQYSGIYTYSCGVDLTSYDYMDFSFSFSIAYRITAKTELRAYKISGGTKTLIKTQILSSGVVDSIGTSLTSVPQTFYTSTITGDIFLNQGEILVVELHAVAFGQDIWRNTANYGDLNVQITTTFAPEVLDTSVYSVDLKPEITFGSLITYSSMLPKIKASDFLRDQCIRFGIILKIDDDTKTIYLNKFDDIYNNVLSSKNWSDKIDKTKPPTIKFKFDSYAQNNLFTHKEDNSILITNDNSDYNLIIQNENLVLDKTIYTSPFAITENTTFNSKTVAYIDLYNTSTSKFNLDVQPRIVYGVLETGFKFTDGTTTSAVIESRRVWFIDDAAPDQSLGFAFMLRTNSKLIIDALQNLKIVKAKFNLSLADIKNLDYFTPVYIESLQSYFFISQVIQYNYTRPELTEVELIKLNP